MLIHSALMAVIRLDYRHVVQGKFGTSYHSGTADWMTKETLRKWHRAYTENGDVDVTQKIPGMRMYNPRWLTMAKVTAKEGNRSVQCPYAKNGTIGHQKTAKNFLRKFQLFSVRRVGVPGFRLFRGTMDRRRERYGRRTLEEWWSPLARKKTKCYLCHRRMQTWSERGIRTDGSLIW